MTPIICLIFTYLIRNVAEDGLKTNIDVENNFYPYKFNDYEAYDYINSIQGPNSPYKTPVRSFALQYYLFECELDTCDK